MSQVLNWVSVLLISIYSTTTANTTAAVAATTTTTIIIILVAIIACACYTGIFDFCNWVVYSLLCDLDISLYSFLAQNMPPSGLSAGINLGQGPGAGVINPAFDPSLPYFQTLSLGRGSKSSLRELDEDDGVDSITWNKHFDSGLVSIFH